MRGEGKEEGWKKTHSYIYFLFFWTTLPFSSSTDSHTFTAMPPKSEEGRKECTERRRSPKHSFEKTKNGKSVFEKGPQFHKTNKGMKKGGKRGGGRRRGGEEKNEKKKGKAGTELKTIESGEGEKTEVEGTTKAS